MSTELNSIFFSHLCQQSPDSRFLFLFLCVIETWDPSSDKLISTPERAMRKTFHLEQDQQKKRPKTNYQQFISHFNGSSWQSDLMLWIINCWLSDYVSILWNKLRAFRNEMITKLEKEIIVNLTEISFIYFVCFGLLDLGCHV